MFVDAWIIFTKYVIPFPLVARSEKHPYHARYDDGKLFYQGEWYSKGHHIIIDNREDSPVQ